MAPGGQPLQNHRGRGKSAGTAVAARSHIGMASIPSVDCTHHLHPQGRFSCKKANAILKGGYHLGCIYQTDTVGALAKCNLDQLESVAYTLDGLKGPFVIGGDWNCTPAELKATGWLKRVNGVIVAPSAPTCNDSTYEVLWCTSPFSILCTACIRWRTLSSHRTPRLGSS